MASAESQLLDAIKRKKAQQIRDKEMLSRRSELYRAELVNKIAKPEYLVGGLCLGIFFSRREKTNRDSGNSQCKNEVSSKTPIWRQIVVDVLDRQVSRFLIAIRRRYESAPKKTPL